MGAELGRALSRIHIFRPNALQQTGVRHVLAGKDLVCCAQTGSGKTLLFMLPFLQRLSERAPLQPRPPPPRAPPRGRTRRPPKPVSRFTPSAPEALVLVPNRELGVQTLSVMRELCAELEGPPEGVLVTGGARFTPQRHALRDGTARLVVATPGRLLYHLDEGKSHKSHVNHLSDVSERILVTHPGALSSSQSRTSRVSVRILVTHHAPCPPLSRTTRLVLLSSRLSTSRFGPPRSARRGGRAPLTEPGAGWGGGASAR